MMNWDRKIGFIDAVINWLKEYEVLGVPKQGKISYFFNPTFLNHVLEVLLDVKDKVDLPRGVQTLNKQISTLKKTPVEHFLDIVSAEFNTVIQTGGSNSNSSEDGKPDLKDINLEILNRFLELIDIELLSVWTDTTIAEDENHDMNTIGNNVYKNAKKIFRNVGLLDTKEIPLTAAKKDLMMYDKKPPKDIISDGKFLKEIQTMSLDEFLNLIDQLFIYMSVLFCVGIFSKRGAWGLVQTNYLSEESKSCLKIWCNDVNYHYIDLGEIEDFEEAKSAISLNLESALGRSAGWLNVRGETESAERIVFKELEDVKAKCKQLSVVNLKLLNEREELSVKNDSLLTIINRLGEEIETFETKLTKNCEIVTILNEEKVKMIEEHKESETRLRNIISQLNKDKTELIESHKNTVEGLNCRIELLKENCKTENDSAEKRIEELHKAYKETITELEGRITELKIEKDTSIEQNIVNDLESKLANMTTLMEQKEEEIKNREKAIKLKEVDIKKRKKLLDQRSIMLKSCMMKFNNDCTTWNQTFSPESQTEDGSNSGLADILALSLRLTNRSNLNATTKSTQNNNSLNENIEPMKRAKAELKSMFDTVKTSMDTMLEDQVNFFYIKLNQLQREVATIKHDRENQILRLKDKVFIFESKMSNLESKIIELSDDDNNNNNDNNEICFKSRTNSIRECFDVKQLVERFNNNLIDQIELKLIVKKNEELLYEDSMGKIYDFKEYDDFESLKIIIPLKFVIDLMTGIDNVGDIQELYKEEMNKLLIRHRKLKNCCKVQRERCIKYNELIKNQIEEDKRILDWIISLNNKVNHIREVIERKVKDSKDENIRQKFEQFLKIFVPFPIEGIENSMNDCE